jgi:hypothetical protein
MKNLGRKVIAAGLVSAALISVRIYAATASKPESQQWTPGCVASVPRSWGVFRGGSTQTGLAFEDGAGTLRFLTNIPCGGTPTVSLEIHRTPAPPSN